MSPLMQSKVVLSVRCVPGGGARSQLRVSELLLGPVGKPHQGQDHQEGCAQPGRDPWSLLPHRPPWPPPHHPTPWGVLVLTGFPVSPPLPGAHGISTCAWLAVPWGGPGPRWNPCPCRPSWRKPASVQCRCWSSGLNQGHHWFFSSLCSRILTPAAQHAC